MKSKKLFKNYNKMKDREKIKFDLLISRDKKKINKKNLAEREKIANTLISLVDEKGEAYFNKDYIIKKIIKLDNK